MPAQVDSPEDPSASMSGPPPSESNAEEKSKPNSTSGTNSNQDIPAHTTILGINIPKISGTSSSDAQLGKITTASDISSASPSATPSQSPAKPDGGLKAGEKAGIAVGAILGVLALIVFIFLYLRRRKSKRKTAGGYYGDAPGNSIDLREKEAGVGIAAIPVSASPTSDRNGHAAGDAALIGRGKSARVVDGSYIEDGDRVGRHATTGHASPAAAGAGVTRKPVRHRSVSDEGRDGAVSSQRQVLNDEERARWEEEERRLDDDIAEAERRRLA